MGTTPSWRAKSNSHSCFSTLIPFFSLLELKVFPSLEPLRVFLHLVPYDQICPNPMLIKCFCRKGLEAFIGDTLCSQQDIFLFKCTMHFLIKWLSSIWVEELPRLPLYFFLFFSQQTLCTLSEIWLHGRKLSKNCLVPLSELCRYPQKSKSVGNLPTPQKDNMILAPIYISLRSSSTDGHILHLLPLKIRGEKWGLKSLRDYFVLWREGH